MDEQGPPGKKKNQTQTLYSGRKQAQVMQEEYRNDI